MRSARPTSASAVSTRSRRSRSRQRGEQQRQLHVLEGGQHRHQVVELEDEADVRGAPVGELAPRSGARCRSPPTRSSPASGLSMPAIRLSSVDLPEPDGPISATKSPAETSRLMSTQHRHDLIAARVGLGQVADRDQRSLRVAFMSAATSPRRSPPSVAARSSGGFSDHLVARLARRPPSHADRRSCDRRATATAIALPSRRHEDDRSPVALRRSPRDCTAVTRLAAARACTSCDRKLTLALISGRMRGSISSNSHLDHHRRLRAIDRRHDALMTAAEAHVRQRVELDLGRLPTLDLGEARFGDVGLDLERAPCPPCVTTAPLESAAEENGVMMSPTFAFLAASTPSNGARISV